MVRPDGMVLPHEVEDVLPYLYEPEEACVEAGGRPTIGLPCVPPPRANPGAETPEGGTSR